MDYTCSGRNTVPIPIPYVYHYCNDDYSMLFCKVYNKNDSHINIWIQSVFWKLPEESTCEQL